MYVCTICNLFAGKSFSTVLRHMGTHRYDPGLHIRCGINSCTEHYKNFESFRSHVYRKHREALVNVSRQAPLNDRLDQEESGRNGDLEIDGWGNDMNDMEHEETVAKCDYDPKRLAALFLLKTREERKITQTAINGIVQDFRGVWRDAVERLQV